MSTNHRSGIWWYPQVGPSQQRKGSVYLLCASLHETDIDAEGFSMTSSKNIPHCHHGSQKLDKPRLTSTPQVCAVALPVGKSSRYTAPKIPILTITHRRHPVCDEFFYKSSIIELTFLFSVIMKLCSHRCGLCHHTTSGDWICLRRDRLIYDTLERKKLVLVFPIITILKRNAALLR